MESQADIETPLNVESAQLNISQQSEQVNPYENQKWKGYVFYLMYTLMFSGIFICAKFIFIFYPEVSPFQLVFTRCAFALVFLMILINFKAKRIFYDEMKREYVLPLVILSLTQATSTIINSITVLHIDIVVVSLVNNTTPMIVCLLAMCFLGERLKKIEVCFMTLTFGAVLMIILCAKDGFTGGETIEQAPFAYILLFLNPFFLAAGIICGKKLALLHELVVVFWTMLTSLLISLLIILIYQQKWDSIQNMNWQYWLLFFAAGLIVVGTLTCKQSAFKYESASSLQNLSFLTAIFSIIADILLFHVTFSILQLVGLLLAIVIYLIQLFFYFKEAQEANQKKEQEKIEQAQLTTTSNTDYTIQHDKL